MYLSFLFLMASLPSLAIAHYVYRLSRSSEKSFSLCVKLLLLGVFIAAPVAFLESGTFPLFYGDGLFVQMLLGVALVEEGAKFLVMKNFVFNVRKFDAPIDGIVYSVMVGLGFALAENLLYVFNGGYILGIMRMFTAIPLHAMCGVILGYYFGKAQLNDGKQKQYLIQGFVFAVVLHGTYNFIATISLGALPLFILLGAAFYLSKSMIAKGQYREILERLQLPSDNRNHD